MNNTKFFLSVALFCATHSRCTTLPDTPRQWQLARAHTLYHEKKYDAAHTLYEQLVVQEPQDKDALMGLANTAYAQKNFARAQAYYQELTNSNLNTQLREHAWFNLGCAHAQQQHYQAALEAFQEVVKRNNHHERAQKNIEILKKLLAQQKNSPKNQSKDSQDSQKEQSNKNQPKDESKNRQQDKQDRQSNQQNQQPEQQSRDQQRPSQHTNPDQHASNQNKNGNTNHQPQQRPHERHDQSPQQQVPRPESNKKASAQQLNAHMHAALTQIADIEKQGQRLYVQAIANQQNNETTHGW